MNSQKRNTNKDAILLVSEKFSWQVTSGDHPVQRPTQNRVSSESFYTAHSLPQLSSDIKILNCLNLTHLYNNLSLISSAKNACPDSYADVSFTSLTRSKCYPQALVFL